MSQNIIYMSLLLIFTLVSNEIKAWMLNTNPKF